MPDYLVLMVFLGGVALAEGIYFLLRDLAPQTAARTAGRRTGGTGDGRPTAEGLSRMLRRPPAPLRRLDAMLCKLAVYRRFDRLCQLAGLRQSTVVVWLAVCLGALLPLPLIAGQARRRGRRMQEQMIDAIEIMVRSLRAGHPISAAITLVAGEMPDPIGSEFALAADEMTYGLDLRDALANLAARIPIADLRYLVVAARVQYGTGGNLADVLASLAEVLRARALTEGKAQALAAEGKLSAWILSLLPVAVGLLVQLFNPNYYRDVAGDPLLPLCLEAGAACLLLGILVMRQLVRFHV